MNWGDPEKLRWIWIVLGLVLLSFLAEASKAGTLRRFADKARLGSMVLSLSYFRRFVKLVCLFSALALIVIAAAQPRSQGERVLVRNTGVDIVIAVDVSQSMLAEDIRPNRLEKAKLELQDLVEIAKGDRIGVVAFAGDAFIQVPLTLDRSAVKLFLKALSPNQIPVPGTVLTRALEVSASMFSQLKPDATEEDKKNQPGRVIILLTDGEDRETKPLEMAKKVAQAGIAVYTIGIGTAEGETIPVKVPGLLGMQFKKDLTGKVIVSKLDEKTLREIAKITGGEYFHSSGGFLEVGKIYRSIQNLVEKETGEGWTIQYDPHYQMPVLIAIILLLLQMIISEEKHRSASKKSKAALGMLVLICLPALVGFEQASVDKNEEANALFRKKKYAEAKALYGEVIQIEPQAEKIEYNLSNVDFQMQDFKKAASGYQKVSQAAKSDKTLAAKAQYNLGNALYRLEDKEKAIEAYKNALRNDPKDLNAKFNLELLMREQQQQKNQDQNKDDKNKNQDQNNPDENQDQNKDQKDGNSSGKSGGDEPQDSSGNQDQQDKDGGGEGDQPKNEGGGGEKPSDQQEQGQNEDKKDQGDQPDQQNQGQGDQQEQEQNKGQEGDQDQPQDQPGNQPPPQPQTPQPQPEGQEPPENEGEAPKPQPLSGRFESILGALSDDEGQLVTQINAKSRPQQIVRRQDW